MEESNKKMEAAGKSGDPNAQAAAALEGLGYAARRRQARRPDRHRPAQAVRARDIRRAAEEDQQCGEDGDCEPDGLEGRGHLRR